MAQTGLKTYIILQPQHPRDRCEPSHMASTFLFTTENDVCVRASPLLSLQADFQGKTLCRTPGATDTIHPMLTPSPPCIWPASSNSTQDSNLSS